MWALYERWQGLGTHKARDVSRETSLVLYKKVVF